MPLLVTKCTHRKARVLLILFRLFPFPEQRTPDCMHECCSSWFHTAPGWRRQSEIQTAAFFSLQCICYAVCLFSFVLLCLLVAVDLLFRMVYVLCSASVSCSRLPRSHSSRYVRVCAWKLYACLLCTRSSCVDVWGASQHTCLI